MLVSPSVQPMCWARIVFEGNRCYASWLNDAMTAAGVADTSRVLTGKTRVLTGKTRVLTGKTRVLTP